MNRFEFTKLAECNVDDFFEDDSAELNFCQEHALMIRTDGGCEFMFFLQNDAGDDVEQLCAGMAEAGLREEFIALVREAAAQGARRILFWND
jgi:hypothetical protein